MEMSYEILGFSHEMDLVVHSDTELLGIFKNVFSKEDVIAYGTTVNIVMVGYFKKVYTVWTTTNRFDFITENQYQSDVSEMFSDTIIITPDNYFSN